MSTERDLKSGKLLKSFKNQVSAKLNCCPDRDLLFTQAMRLYTVSGN